MLESRSLKEKAWKKQIAAKCGVRRMIGKAAALSYNTTMEKSLSPVWVKAVDSFVIPNPIDIAPRADGTIFRQRFDLGKSTLLFGTFGRLHPRKGFDVLLPSLAMAASRIDFKLLIVGPDEAGYQKELEEMSRALKLRDRVIFTGELSGGDLARAYASVDMMVLPSYGESFGNVIVEAAAQGTPCYISDQVGLRDWVEENDVGLVLPLDGNAWAEKFSGANRNEISKRWSPDRLARLAKENFSVEYVAGRMVEEYKKILNERKEKLGHRRERR
jgi:glycosyltransferase involved in cell wall biosynthesis